MSNVGRRVRLTDYVGGGREATSPVKRGIRTKCGKPGDYATVVVDEPAHDRHSAHVYVIVDGCDCVKPHQGGCDGLPINAHYFEWADDAPKAPSNNDLCSCDWGHVMTFGCSCGGK